MIKKKSQIRAPYLYGLAAIVGLAVISTGGLLFYTHSLSDKVSQLEAQNERTEKKLAMYERSLCKTNFDLTEADRTTEHSASVNGETRTYSVHTPNNYDPTVRYPVILSFHGIDSSGEHMESYSELDALPAILVYPDSRQGSAGFTAWQGAPYSPAGDGDVQFVEALLDQLPSQYCTDKTQTYAVGMSNGGGFATLVGCRLGDTVSAVASVSGAYYSACKDEEKTPSLLAIHSTTDQRVPFAGEERRGLPQVLPLVEEQAQKRECQSALPLVKTDLTVTYSWRDCHDNSQLRLLVVRGQDHGWLQVPQSSDEKPLSTADYIWKFFEESAYYEQ